MKRTEPGRSAIRLRPHHLLCVQKYTGNGYDARFTAYMNALVERLKSEPDAVLTLTEGEDDLCAVCPNRVDGICVSSEKVTRMDRGVLNACKFSYGQPGSFSAFRERAKAAVFGTDQFESICLDCEWFPLCKRTDKGMIDP